MLKVGFPVANFFPEATFFLCWNHLSRQIPSAKSMRTIDINRSGLPACMFFALKLALSIECHFLKPSRQGRCINVSDANN